MKEFVILRVGEFVEEFMKELVILLGEKLKKEVGHSRNTSFSILHFIKKRILTKYFKWKMILKDCSKN